MVLKSSTRSSLLVLHGSWGLVSYVCRMGEHWSTYVAHENDGPWLGAGRGVIGEWVWRGLGSGGRSTSSITTSLRHAVVASATTVASATSSESAAKPSTTTAETTSESATCSSISSGEPAATSKTPTKASTTSEAWSTASVAVLTNLENAALPIVAVELLNGVLSVVWVVECDDARALGTTILSRMNVGTNNGTSHHYTLVSTTCAGEVFSG